jgi:hypothetical protein
MLTGDDADAAAVEDVGVEFTCDAVAVGAGAASVVVGVEMSVADGVPP